jgi:predicted ArsR family transcriptional regulator
MVLLPEPPQPLRVRVLDALQQAPGATAEQIAQRLDIDGESIPRQVRRSLAELEVQGLACRRPGPRAASGGRAPNLWRPSGD